MNKSALGTSISTLLKQPPATIPQVTAPTIDRKTILLRAAYDLLKRASMAHYVLEAGRIEVHYDQANCDGHCLMDDIRSELDLDPDTRPIPLSKEDENP